MKKIFARTAKAEHVDAELSHDLKRTLSFINGKSSAGELVKRAPPSLRIIWNELISELVDGGYIVEVPKADIDKKVVVRNVRPIAVAASKAENASNDNDLDFRSPSARAQVTTELAKLMEKEAARIRAERDAAAAKKANADKKAKAEAKLAEQKAARARDELKAFFIVAKEKAKAEAKQAELDAARVHAEQQAAAAKARSEAEEKSKAEAKQKKEQAVHAEIEAAILAPKIKPEIDVKDKQEAKVVLPIAPTDLKHLPGDAQRLHDLEIENDSLKQLLVEAYIEINSLKSALEVKQ